MTLPALIPWQEMRERLLVIFPEGMPDRGFLVRDMTARTVFTALYLGAVAGSDTWLAPRHVLRMSDGQAACQDDTSRRAYLAEMSKAKAPSPPGRWYAENTREPLRDEVIRQGLVPVNAMVERAGVPTTSPAGRYALQPAFAALFHPALTSAQLEAEAEAWRRAHLSAAALARAALVRASASTASGNITVQCPGGPSIILPPGPSPIITKAVIEVFAPAFLGDPRVAWVSDSANKRPFRDAPLEKALGITLDAAELLPDVVLVDLDPPNRPGEALLVFVEVVASDGPVTEQRLRTLLDLIAASPRRYRPEHAAFITAYMDRGGDPARRTMSRLAWRSFAWFVSEPDKLLQLHDGRSANRKLAALL
ncbi:BsuBI/PstI family type II restriction endonuclease [Elioraea sp.]|uniref:BsuBI/PstI family type II restriction endonuclease n=1 Tax=Elioraea sp. TaxID=2185103 RepID=UPI003F70E47C